MIRDQRTMTGDRPHATVDDVRTYWAMWARERGFALRSGVTSRELTLRIDLEATVYVSAGCLVADCPNPECNGAAACWEQNPEACCLDCGTVFRPRWPTAEEMGGELREALDVLSLRPVPMWRNFRASHKDETVADLKAQNLAVGDAIPGGKSASGPHPLDPALVRG